MVLTLPEGSKLTSNAVCIYICNIIAITHKEKQQVVISYIRDI